MTCSSRGNLWPVPTGRVQVSQDLVKFLPQELRLVAVTAPSDQVSGRKRVNDNDNDNDNDTKAMTPHPATRSGREKAGQRVDLSLGEQVDQPVCGRVPGVPLSHAPKL